MPSTNRTPLRLVLCALVWTALPAPCVQGHAAPNTPTVADPYRRLGDEAHLVEIREAETKPFDFERLASLPGWHGEPLDAETVGDRLLVLLAWDQADPKSVRLLPTLARLQRTMSDKAACVAVHVKNGWEDAAQKIDAGRVPIPAAHDADGELLASLAADEHPNLYIIDRSGHVRIADLDPRDLPKALITLAKETPEDAAADLPRRITLHAEASRLVPRVPGGEPGHDDGTPEGDAPMDDRAPGFRPPPIDPGSVPPALRGLLRPAKAAYDAAAWPDRNRDGFRATDVQGLPLPVPLGQETWLTEKPQTPLNDRVLVVDFWATWCGPCLRASPTLDALQQRHKDDLLVMAVSGQARPGAPEDERTIRAHTRRARTSYAYVHDADQRVYKSLQIRAIPHVLVMSTDGVVRWQGNPLAAEFQRVVAGVIEADPLLAARKAQQPARQTPADRARP